jgi:hypothetical protein
LSIGEAERLKIRRELIKNPRQKIKVRYNKKDERWIKALEVIPKGKL